MKKATFKSLLLLLVALFCLAALTACFDAAFAGNCLEFKNFTVDESAKTVYGVLPNDTETFSFSDEILPRGKANYGVYLDIYCSQEVKSKTVPLTAGDNTFYLLASGTDSGDLLYTVTLRRKPLYQIAFQTQGGSSVAGQSVEEGNCATLPTENPTKEGYTFSHWDFDFMTPITASTTVKAVWTLSPDASYTVRHHQENLSDGGYTLCETETLVGTAGSLIAPKVKTYEGFLSPTMKPATIAPDGSTVVDYYYARARYTLTVVGNGGSDGTFTLKYQEALDPAKLTTREGYSVGGLYTNKALTRSLSAMPAADTTVYAHWLGENKPGDFEYSTLSGIIINDYLGSGTEVVIPAQIGGESVTAIGMQAFHSCTDLTSITIPDSVTAIRQQAFYLCTKLASITIPANVAEIGWEAFYGCRSLASITVAEENSSYHAEGNCLIKGGILIRGCNTSVIPSNITMIGESAFSGCIDLTSITIPDSVTTIGQSAFEGCNGLTSIEIPDSVTWINKYAFRGCAALESITIPDSVTAIGAYAFSDCIGLTSITFADTTTWYCTGSEYFWQNKSGGSQTSVTSPAENAADFTFNYNYDYWYKK